MDDDTEEIQALQNVQKACQLDAISTFKAINKTHVRFQLQNVNIELLTTSSGYFGGDYEIGLSIEEKQSKWRLFTFFFIYSFRYTETQVQQGHRLRNKRIFLSRPYLLMRIQVDDHSPFLKPILNESFVICYSKENLMHYLTQLSGKQKICLALVRTRPIRLPSELWRRVVCEFLYPHA